ncbi:MAG: response regulator transcription factor [Gemmatimonadales bacterium]
MSGRADAYSIRATLLETGPLVGCEPAVLFTIERAAPARPTSAETLESRFGLTPREAQVADLLSQGMSNREVADQLQIGVHTARRHAEHLFAKLGVRRRAEVAALVAGTVKQPAAPNGQ